MMIWEPIEPVEPAKQGVLWTRMNKAAKAGCHIVLYFTPERGWYGWTSIAELDVEPMERVYPLRLADGTIAAVCGSQIVKAAAAIELDAPDEISTDERVLIAEQDIRPNVGSRNGD
jgi:hypothetical protein